MSAEDKYPESSGRRRFVKGVVGSASLAAVGTAGAVSMDLATNRTGTGGGTTTYYAIENTDGPAPRGMPMIPIEVDDDGFIKGHFPKVQEVERDNKTVKVAREDLGGITYASDWFQYCGLQGYDALDPEYSGDDYFRYASAGYEWHSDLTGNRVNVEDFAEYETWGNGIGKSGIGMPAMVTWRNQNVENPLPAQVLRSEKFARAKERATGDVKTWLEAATDGATMAYLDKCTHFCCIPGFKKTEQSREFGAADLTYCPCHQSVYDPFSIVKRTFVAFPRPEEG